MLTSTVLEGLLSQLAQKPEQLPADARSWGLEVLRHLIIAKQKGGTTVAVRAENLLDAAAHVLQSCLDEWRKGPKSSELAIAVDRTLACASSINDPFIRTLAPGDAQVVTAGVGMIRMVMFQPDGGNPNAEATTERAGPVFQAAE